MCPERRFWEEKSLEALTMDEWEQLCDGCGLCCLHKLVDEEQGHYFFTRVACRYLDLGTARCRVYEQRQALMPTCMQLTPADAHRWTWLPLSCAYRLRAENKRLPGWHPLVSGCAESVRRSGKSLPENVVLESNELGDLEEFIVSRKAI